MRFPCTLSIRLTAEQFAQFTALAYLAAMTPSELARTWLSTAVADLARTPQPYARQDRRLAAEMASLRRSTERLRRSSERLRSVGLIR